MNNELLPLPSRGAHSPTIVNCTKHTIVVFQERGTLFNRQVLHPNEALCITAHQTGGGGGSKALLPNNPLCGSYKVHAAIGDETCLPTAKDNAKNLLRVSVVPAAFVAATLATAMSAGMLAGPSAALAPLVTGLVVKGVVIDSAALVAGGVVANRTQVVTELLLAKKRNHLLCETGWLKSGRPRYLVVTGGLDDGPLVIEEMKPKSFRQVSIKALKSPTPNGGKGQKQKGKSKDTGQAESQYYLPSSAG